MQSEVLIYHPFVSIAADTTLNIPVVFVTSNISFTAFSSTVTVHVAVLFSACAVIVALPAFTAVITPFSTEATSGASLVQVTVLSVASSGVTVAVSVFVSPLP